MEHIEKFRESLPEAAKDIKLNLLNVLQGGSLSPSQIWGVAVASAYAARNPRLTAAIEAEARAAGTPDTTLEDAKASAALMGMNNVYYRFRHMISKESYGQMPARLRMNRLVQPLGSKIEFELFNIAVSAINGCEACLRSHEEVVIKGEMTEEQVHDAVRIASVVHAAAIAGEMT